MEIYFMAQYGVNPWKKLLLLRKYNLESKVFPLGIGGRRVGSFKWLITSISNNLKTFYKNGKVTEVMVSVTFKEYPYKKGNAGKKKTVKSSKKNGTLKGELVSSSANEKRKTRSFIYGM